MSKSASYSIPPSSSFDNNNDDDDDNRRILSIQSHVVHGHVGNKSAVFPLQLLGFEVDFINSVQFSNHTGYKHGFKGQRLNHDELEQLIEGLKQNELLDYTHLLTGYVGDATFLNKLADLIDELKTKNPDLIYLCDPVLGDDGALYVPKELIEIYIERIIPKANIITPNLFELELITGLGQNTINSEQDVLKALDVCHSKGVQTVIISSCKPFDSSDADSSKKLLLYASSSSQDCVIKIEFDRLPCEFTGTGDCFAAMFIAWYTKLDQDLQAAIEHTVSSMIAILNRTFASKSRRELKLVRSKEDIEHPKLCVHSEKIKRPTSSSSSSSSSKP